MLEEKKRQIKAQFFSHIHTLLPLVAPLFLQMASSLYLINRLPILFSFSPALGLVVSYLFGPAGFFFSALCWGGYLSLMHTEQLMEGGTIVFFISCLISWWLSSLCAEQYQQKIVDLEEMISAIFNKNNDLEKHAKEALVAIREERKEGQRLKEEMNAEIDTLRQELSSHRHHLSLAWQESSHLKEESEKQRKELMASLECAQSQSLFYMQQKQSTETLLSQTSSQLESLIKEMEEKQNNFLEEFRQFQQKNDNLQEQLNEKEAQIQAMEDKLQSCETSGESIDSHNNASYQVLYTQLQEHMQEKSETLTHTKEQLRAIEEKLLLAQKIQQEADESPSREETLLVESLRLLIKECEDLKTEVHTLEEIITVLHEKKKVAREKKESKGTLHTLIHTPTALQETLF